MNAKLKERSTSNGESTSAVSSDPEPSRFVTDLTPWCDVRRYHETFIEGVGWVRLQSLFGDEFLEMAQLEANEQRIAAIIFSFVDEHGDRCYPNTPAARAALAKLDAGVLTRISEEITHFVLLDTDEEEAKKNSEQTQNAETQSD